MIPLTPLLKDHVEQSCDYRSIKCRYCENVIIKYAYQDHLLFYCKKKMVRNYSYSLPQNLLTMMMMMMIIMIILIRSSDRIPQMTCVITTSSDPRASFSQGKEKALALAGHVTPRNIGCHVNTTELSAKMSWPIKIFISPANARAFSFPWAKALGTRLVWLF